MKDLRAKVILGVIFGVLVMLGLTMYADAPKILVAFTHFTWQYLPLILGFTLLNYILRFFKWQYYLRILCVHLSWADSAIIFLAGLSMAITPGKVGEFLKSYLLKQRTGVPMAHTAPMVVCERLTDGLAMLILASSGLVLYHLGWQILVLLAGAGVLGVVFIQNRSLSLRLLSAVERISLLARFVQHIRVFYESSYILLRWPALLLAIGLGLLSWGGECVAFYFVLRGLGLAATPQLLVKATFILATNTIIGSATGLPGGLGAADVGIVKLLLVLVTPLQVRAVAAALLIRGSTLWFGVALGAIGMIIFHPRLAAIGQIARTGSDEAEVVASFLLEEPAVPAER